MCKVVPHSASFNIRNADDFLREMILPQHADFLRNNASARHALLAITLVYHMYEWVHGVQFSRTHFAKHYPSEPGIADYLELAKAITNGTKHFRSKAKTRVQAGFSSDFSEDFARPLNLEFQDGSETSADEFLGTLVEFWKRQQQRTAT